MSPIIPVRAHPVQYLARQQPREKRVPIVDYYKLAVFEKYAQFDGRSGRAEYWWFALGNIIIGVVLSLLARASIIFVLLYFAYALATLVPGIAAGIRRLHDTNRSGWWLLISFVPCVGFIVLIVFLATAGDPHPNQYGPPPA
jgi:uncharacterized membrane protein YhaH (DUF805 family)